MPKKHPTKPTPQEKPSAEWLAEMALKVRATEKPSEGFNIGIGKGSVRPNDLHFARRAFDYYRAAVQFLQKQTHAERLAIEEDRIFREVTSKLTTQERASKRLALTRGAKFVTGDDHKDRALTKFRGFVDLLESREGFWESVPDFEKRGILLAEVVQLRTMWDFLDYKSEVREFLSWREKNYLTRPLPPQPENQPQAKKSRPPAAQKRPRLTRRSAK